MRWYAFLAALVLGMLLVCTSVIRARPAATAQTVGSSVTYAAGWNLVSTPAGSSNLPSGPYYALSPGATDYLKADVPPFGFGYWAYFAGATPVMLGVGTHAPLVVEAPADVWVMVGNPSGLQTAGVQGASVVLTYSPASGYRQVTALAPGQGAWALSLTGGPITVIPSGPVPVPGSVPEQPALAPQPATFSSVPQGATAICNDGTYSYNQISQSSCAGHGGVAQQLVPLSSVGPMIGR